MQLRRYSNAAVETELDGSISLSDTTLAVLASAGYPDPPFTITVDGEVLLVTAVAGLDWTVERGYDTSVPAFAHSSGSVVKLVLTSDDFNHRWQDPIVTPRFASLDDEFDDEDLTGLSTVSFGTTSWIESNGMLSAKVAGEAANNVSAKLIPLTAIPIGTGVEVAARAMALSNTVHFGPILASGASTTHDLVFQSAYLNPDTRDLTFALRSGTFTSCSTSHFTDTALMVGGWIYMRLVWVSVNLFRAWWSVDGVTYTDFGKGSFSITGLSPPNFMGVGVSAAGGSGDKLVSFDHIRTWEL